MTNRGSAYAGFALGCLVGPFGVGLIGSMLMGDIAATPGTIIAGILLAVGGWVAVVRGARRIVPGVGTGQSSEPAVASAVVGSGRRHTAGWWITRYSLMVLTLSALSLVVAVSTGSASAWAAALIGILQAPLTIAFGRRMDR